MCVALLGFGAGARATIGAPIRPRSISGRAGAHGRRLRHCILQGVRREFGVSSCAGTGDALEDSVFYSSIFVFLRFAAIGWCLLWHAGPSCIERNDGEHAEVFACTPLLGSLLGCSGDSSNVFFVLGRRHIELTEKEQHLSTAVIWLIFCSVCRPTW